NRLDRCAPLRRNEYPIPFDAPRASLPESRHELAAHRPGELAAQVRKSIVVIDRKLLDRPPQLLQELLQPALLTLQTLEVLSVRVGFGCKARQHSRALLARLLELRKVRPLLFFQLGQLRVLSLQLLIERRDGHDIVLDAMNLLGTRTSEVAVVDEHASGPLGVLLIQQELQRLFAPDQIGRAQLPRQGTAVLAQVPFPRALFSGERSTFGGTFRAAPPDLVQ